MEIRLNQARVETLLHGTGKNGLVHAGLRRASRHVVDQAKINITTARRVDTGRLRNSGGYQIHAIPGALVSTVSFDTHYALYQELGTANNGQGFIYPRRAKVLRFEPSKARKSRVRKSKRSGVSSEPQFVFAQRVRGVRGVHYLTRALDSLTSEHFERR